MTITHTPSGVPLPEEESEDKVEGDFVCPHCGKTEYIIQTDKSRVCEDCLKKGKPSE